MNPVMLVIDDDPSFNAILVRTLGRRGQQASGALDTAAALAKAREIKPERVVLDLNLNGSSGLALIPQLLDIVPDCRIVVLTGYASIATAVDAVKLGAIQYLAKPVEVEAILSAFDEDASPDFDVPISDEPLSVRPTGMGTHPARPERKRRQYFSDRQSPQNASAHPATQALQAASQKLRAPAVYNSMKASAATMVGGKAASNNPNGLTDSSVKLDFRIATPAGFGALAIMVRPPPVTAPATTAYWKAGVTPCTSEAR